MPNIKSILENISQYEIDLAAYACRIDKIPVLDKDGGRTRPPREVFSQVADKDRSVSTLLYVWHSLQRIRKALEDN